MFDITLISSFHMITGKCNPNELYNIIENLQPDMIFEELSYDIFETIYSAGYQPQSLEAIAIKRYLQKYSVEHFPVDNYPINEKDLLSDAQVIWNNSVEYRDLWNQKLLKLNQGGYYFINSRECIEMVKELHYIEETVLDQLKNSKLSNELKIERALHDKRETEMLKNIYNKSIQCPYEKAVFICGAEHRQRLKEKIKEYEVSSIVKLNWTYFNEQ